MQSSYHEIRFLTDAPFVDLLADFVASVSDEAIEYGSDGVILRSEKDPCATIEAVERLAQEAQIPLKIEREEKENKDWIRSYQEGVRPIEAGPFYVHPDWYPPKEG